MSDATYLPPSRSGSPRRWRSSETPARDGACCALRFRNSCRGRETLTPAALPALLPDRLCGQGLPAQGAELTLLLML